MSEYLADYGWLGWIVIGQAIYFGYGYAHSKLRKSLG